MYRRPVVSPCFFSLFRPFQVNGLINKPCYVPSHPWAPFRLPWAVEVAAHPDRWEVTVDELTVKELGRRVASEGERLDSSDGTRAVYALTASIVYVQEVQTQ